MLNYSIDSLDALRSAEMRLLFQKYGQLFSGADVLEIGTGTGAQLRELSAVANSAIGVDLHSSYLQAPSYNFTYYDGVNLPFADNSFDVIYSSNTMEHVMDEPGIAPPNEKGLAAGRHRGPRRTRSCAWRMWTTAVYYPMLPKLIFSFLLQPKDQSTAEGSPAAHTKSAKDRILDLICPKQTR